MKALIGQFYKTLEGAIKKANANKEMWKGRLGWFVVKTDKGFLVISETQARLCGYKVSHKTRRYEVTK